MLKAMVLTHDELDVPADGTVSMSALNDEARRNEVNFDLVLVIDSGKVTVLKNRVGPIGEAIEIESFTNMFPQS